VAVDRAAAEGDAFGGHGAPAGLKSDAQTTDSIRSIPTQSLEGWGRIQGSAARVIPIGSSEAATDSVRRAGSGGHTIISRGSGYSYGDPALNRNNIVLDLKPMDRILAWDPNTGVIDVEPGVTVGRLCRHVASAGWWPPVVPGTQYPTIGGCVAANVHGKNNWKLGPIGEHVEEIEMLVAGGGRVVCGPALHPDLFRAIVGGFGLFGVMTRIRLRMEKSSSLLHVEHYAAPELEDVMAILDRWSERADYMVAWIDGFANGKDLGRGLVQIADVMPSGSETDRPGISPTDRMPTLIRGNLWRAMKPVANQAAMRALNAAQYVWGSMQNGRGSFRSRYRFEFFHDAVPGWNRAFRWGIIQYQMFVPREGAPSVFRQALEESARRGLPPFLAVLKRHREDSFLLSEGVDGYSLSMDFNPAQRGQAGLAEHLRRFTDEIVLPAGGRFYLAKDSILTASQARQSFGDEVVREFLRLKRELDPNELFQSDMYRRLFR
jgi:decaprenylphospho-beta-D-ribofuranose 2-oxidase